ncbi:hypothetical protein [Pinirhizobacter soli]|uniref:hypothetical protein n=1 Tax=Pinirhizobacter soli TaxID=2786953 RepID=UPI002029E88D|nr:hypothetical protein [Pinirhizobacter soli]
MYTSNDTEVHRIVEVLTGSAVQLQKALLCCVRSYARASANAIPPLEPRDLRQQLGLLRELMFQVHPAGSDILRRFETWREDVDAASVQRDFLLIRARRGVEHGPSLFELTRATVQLERDIARIKTWEEALTPP